MNTCNNRITYSVVRDIRRQAFDKLTTPTSEICGFPTLTAILSVVLWPTWISFPMAFSWAFTQFFSGIMTILGTLVFMVSINYKIALVVLLITPVSLFVAAFISKRSYAMFKLQSETRGELTAHIDEMIGNQKVVQAFGHEDGSARTSFRRSISVSRAAALKRFFFSSITNPATPVCQRNLSMPAWVLPGLSQPSMAALALGQLSAFFELCPISTQSRSMRFRE